MTFNKLNFNQQIFYIQKMFNLFVRKQAAFCSNFLSKNTAIKQFSFNNNSKYIKQSFLNINKKNFSNLPSVKTTYK